jgi:hypothetical protein
VSSLFLLVFLIALVRISLLGEVNLCAPDNQRSCDIVTIRVQRSIRSLRYQHGDVHQSINLYLLKVQDSTSHQVVSYFVIVFITSYPEKAKTFYTFCYHISFRAAIFVSGCFVEFVFIMV